MRRPDSWCTETSWTRDRNLTHRPRGPTIYGVDPMAQKQTDAATWLAEHAAKVRANDPEFAAVLEAEAAIERERVRRAQVAEQLADRRLAN
jgi:hypothetical protein